MIGCRLHITARFRSANCVTNVFGTRRRARHRYEPRDSSRVLIPTSRRELAQWERRVAAASDSIFSLVGRQMRKQDLDEVSWLKLLSTRSGRTDIASSFAI